MFKGKCVASYVSVSKTYSTPYSMNRLFSEFFREFGGAFLEVCETISRDIWQVLRGKIKENYPEKNKETNQKNPIRYY